MASLTRRRDGSYRLQFGPKTCRKHIELGQMSADRAQDVKSKIEALAAARDFEWPPKLASWVAKLTNEQHARLAVAGLVPPRRSSRPKTLGPYLEDYISGRADLKPITRR